jgi:hypothetical protein
MNAIRWPYDRLLLAVAVGFVVGGGLSNRRVRRMLWELTSRLATGSLYRSLPGA